MGGTEMKAYIKALGYSCSAVIQYKTGDITEERTVLTLRRGDANILLNVCERINEGIERHVQERITALPKDPTQALKDELLEAYKTYLNTVDVITKIVTTKINYRVKIDVLEAKLKQLNTETP
jgi:hypothetical protein